MGRGVVVVALALIAAGCGGHHAAPHRTPTGGSPAQRSGGDRPPSTREQLQSLLDRRAQALLAGEPAAYAATSTRAARARDRRAVRDAARLGLRDVRLQLRRARVQGRRARLTVVAGWAVDRVRGIFRSERTLLARRTRAGWRIAGAAGTRGRPPWEVGAYRRVDERHFVVLAPVGLDVTAAGLPAALAGGYARIAAALPRAPLRRRYLAMVAPRAAAARALTVKIAGLESLAAVADTAVRQSGPAERVRAILSQRLLVVWPQFEALPSTERAKVVTHELTHLVLAGSTSGRTPSWLVEGIALYVSGDRRSAEASAVLRGAATAAALPALSLRRLSGPHAIGRLTGAQQAGAYAYASAAAFAIADRYGQRALLRLYDAFDDPTLRGRPGPRLVDRAMQRTLGTSLEDFERRLRASLS